MTAKDPKPLFGYQKTIHELDPTINAAGVEFSMRLQYGVLDHLDKDIFRQEIELAHELERQEPGYLRRNAETYGGTAEYDNAEHHVKVVVPAKPPTIHRPRGLVL